MELEVRSKEFALPATHTAKFEACPDWMFVHLLHTIYPLLSLSAPCHRSSVVRRSHAGEEITDLDAVTAGA